MTEGLTLSKDWTFSPRSGLGGLRTGLDCGKPKCNLASIALFYRLHLFDSVVACWKPVFDVQNSRNDRQNKKEMSFKTFGNNDSKEHL